MESQVFEASEVLASKRGRLARVSRPYPEISRQFFEA